MKQTQKQFEKQREKLADDMIAAALAHGETVHSVTIKPNKKHQAEITKFLKELNKFENKSRNSKLIIG